MSACFVSGEPRWGTGDTGNGNALSFFSTKSSQVPVGDDFLWKLSLIFCYMSGVMYK